MELIAETPTVKSFTLALPEEKPLHFLPGQWCDLFVPTAAADGTHGGLEVFSVCGVHGVGHFSVVRPSAARERNSFHSSSSQIAVTNREPSE